MAGGKGRVSLAVTSALEQAMYSHVQPYRAALCSHVQPCHTTALYSHVQPVEPPPCTAAACTAPQVPPVFLKQLAADKQIFKDLPAKVQRQVCMCSSHFDFWGG